MGGHVARMGEIRNIYNTLVGNLEGKRLFGRPWCSGKLNIKMDLREIGWEAEHWMLLYQDRDQWRTLVNTVINFLAL
jgi:hypothetical protein